MNRAINIVTLDQERFQQNDISTQLGLLATHLTHIQGLMPLGEDEAKVGSLIRESLYFIEWTIPQYLEMDVDRAAELVDLGRVLAQWRFNWEKIWVDSDARVEVAQQAEGLAKQVQKLSEDISLQRLELGHKAV
jgi:hypothetical protein